MYLVVIAWLYVAVLMALAEGVSSQGSWLGAGITFLLYGLLPISVVVYIMGTPLRRKARLQEEAKELEVLRQSSTSAEVTPPSSLSATPDPSGHTTGAPHDGRIPSVREKP